MSSTRVDNSGHFQCEGSLLVGNTFSTSGGDVHFHASDSNSRARSLELGLHFGDAPTIEAHLFIGRSSELQTIKEALHPRNAPQEQRRVILGGLGGVGKTQLAIAYARQYHQHHSSIFWLNASTELSLQASLQTVARRVSEGQDLEKLNGEQILAYTYAWLSNPNNPRWLLVFDNYDDPQQYDLSKYHPYTGHGSIIITTRVPHLVRISGHRIQIRSLDNIEESLQIIRTRSQRDSVKNDPHARRLAQQLAGLPLALATAGAYLRKTTLTFEQYLQAYEKRFEVSPRRPVQLQEYADRTLYTTWNLSYNQIEQDDPYAAKMLKLLAYFDYKEIWYELLYAGIKNTSPEWLQEVTGERIDFENVMSALVDYCLLETNSTFNHYSVHKCVHDWVLSGLNRDIDTELYWYAFDCVKANINEDDWDTLGQVKYTRVTQHGVRLTDPRFATCDQSNGGMSERLDESVLIAQMLKQQLQLSAAQRMYLRALAGHEKALGLDHTSTLNTVNNLGLLYADQGKLEEAEQMYERALAGKEKTLGQDHASTLNTVHNLGTLYRDQGKLKAAEQMLLRALSGTEKALGPNHTSTLSTVNNLGLLYADQGKLEEAEQMYERALAGKEKTLGQDHASTLSTVNNLGNLYSDQGKLEAAEQMYLRALAGREKVLGQDHTSTIKTVNNLALLYKDQGKLDEAEQMFERTLSAPADRLTDSQRKTAVYGFAVVLSKGICSQAADAVRTPDRMAHLVKHVQEWGRSDARIIYRLAGTLVWIRDDKNAALAYHSLTCVNDMFTGFEGIICDGCSCSITLARGHHHCRQCEDVDLCSECMSKYAADNLPLSMCHSDDFYDIGAAVSQALPLSEFQNKIGMDAWFAQLRDKYQAPSEA